MNYTLENMMDTAVILAGGKSSRMGFDKQLLEREDHKTLTIALCEQLLQDFRHVVVVTRTPELYAHQPLPITICQDVYPGKGPISGIHSAFYHSDAEFVFVMACDMTGYSSAYARYEAERMIQERTEACVTLHGENGKADPFHGFFARSLYGYMENCLTDPDASHSIVHLLDHHAVTRIAEEDAAGYCDVKQLFRNLNTPKDYKDFAAHRNTASELKLF